MPDEASYKAAKQRALGAEQSQEAADGKGKQRHGPTPMPTPFALVGTGGVQKGISAADTCGICVVPDTTGSINSNYYMEIVNERVAVYNRSLASVEPSVDLGTFGFAGSVPSGQLTTDPQVQWDQAAGRWLYALISINATETTNYILWGWSKSADPTDLTNGWCKYSLATNAELDDFPKLGHDSKALAIGANTYTNGSFLTSKLWVVVLPGAGVTTCPSLNVNTFGTPKSPINNADGTKAFTPIPANTTDSGSNDRIVAAHEVYDGSTKNKVMAWHLSYSKSGVPSLTADGDYTVSSFTLPPSVPQPGTAYVLDTGEGNLTQAVSQVDPDTGGTAIWTQHTIRDPNGSAYSVVRWYEFIVFNMSVRQSADVVTVPAATNTFDGAISPTSTGNQAALFFNQGDGANLQQIVAETRLSSTPLSTMDFFGATLAQSTVPDTDTSSNSTCNHGACRWGDYSGASPDPANSNQVWGTSQTTGTGGSSSGPGWYSYNFSVSTILPPTCNTTTLTAGENHSLAVDVNGAVWAWGLGNSGQIGNNSSSNALSPAEVWSPSGVGFLTGVHSVAATQTASFAVLSNGGAVYYWGSPYGETYSPIPIGQPDPVNDRSGFMTGVIQLAGGWQHVVALKNDGTVWAWGQNVYGQLGNGSTNSSSTPVRVNGISNAIAIAAGHDHGMALLTDGSVWAWGDNEFAQLGQNTAGPGSYSTIPLQVKGAGGVGYLTAAYGISAGTEAGGSFALSSDLTLWAWGTLSPSSSWTPAHVPTSSGSGAISSSGAVGGSNHRLVIDSTGFAWAYGPDNSTGALGNGNNSPSTYPTQIKGVGGTGQLSTIVEMAAGLAHSAALDIRGNVTAWGYGANGQLGNGGTSNSNTPVPVSLSHLIAQPSHC